MVDSTVHVDRLLNASFVVERYSTAGPQAVPKDETAYPYRDIETHL